MPNFRSSGLNRSSLTLTADKMQNSYKEKEFKTWLDIDNDLGCLKLRKKKEKETTEVPFSGDWAHVFGVISKM